MSTTIDERVVEMRFDNRHFESNVKTSMTTLERLKNSLNLESASKSLNSISDSAKKINLSSVGNAVDSVAKKFSAMEIMAVTTIANITNSAVNAGKKIASALTIDPIKTGFQEYETQINAVQTILANTSHNGTTIDEVNTALDTLNTYADKTIYNFTQMTKNIGTFTAAGVDLETSVKSIQGIANLAAVSGSSSQQASTAMYQLSQALAAGKVSLQDWNSVVNAGMGGKVFQNALIRTSEAMGTGAEEAIEKYGSFRASLTQGEWLTTDVLTKTLEQFTMAAEEGSEEWNAFKKSLMEEGYTEAQAEEILKMANTATDAATKVKTFSQLWETLKESAQSGWTQTWEILIGDFEEAKEMLTKVSDVVGGFIQKTADARNNLLQGWKDAGGRTDLLDSFANTFKFLGEVVKPITEAFREVFPALKVEHLTAITDGLKSFTEKLHLSSDASEKLKITFKGVFSFLSLMGKALGVVVKAIWELLTSDGMAKLATFLLDIAAAIGDFFTKINEGLDTAGISGLLSGMVNGISDIFGGAIGHIENFGDLITAVGDIIINVAKKVWSGIKTVFQWITDTFSAGDLFAGLAGAGIFKAGTDISKFFSKLDLAKVIKKAFGIGEKGSGSASKLMDGIKDVLGSVSDSLNAFTTSVKISSLVSIAVAVGILSASLRTISEIDAAGVVKSLAAIGVMMTMLCKALESVSDTVSFYGSGGLIKAAGSLILMATAINILAKAMEKIGGLSFPEIVKGLIGIGGGLTALCLGLKAIGKTKVSLSTSVAILALAKACDILGDALQKFGSMSWDEIERGLSAMGIALAEFVVAIGLLNEFGGFKSLIGSGSILLLVESLDEIADALQKFGSMTWDQIERGISTMGMALAELVVTVGLLNAFGGFKSLVGSGAILLVVQSLDEIADALQKFGSMTWSEIERGISGMGLALAELVVALGLLSEISGYSSIFAAGAIVLVVEGLDEIATTLKDIGSMTWDQLEVGFTGMGIALGELVMALGALAKVAGFSGIFASGAILIATQGLNEIADSLVKIGGLTWDQIGLGLTGMGVALMEISMITGALGYLAGLPALLGGGAILLAVQGLGDLADALAKFGEMSWDEIGRGLAAMGGALSEIALGGILNTLSGLGAVAITEMAGSLGTLADSVKKWADVTMPEGLGAKLSQLAVGVAAFTTSGLGASALAEVATPLGTLADSVKKWVGVTIPEGLGTKLGTLADGVNKFWSSGLGASALAEVATPLGDMADSVAKWSGVTVPDNIGTDLTNVATGVKAFSFAFAGGWSLSSLVTPLGDLADSVKKWADVTVSDTLSTDLTSLASGVKAFSFAFAGGWSMSAIVTPLGDLATSVKKWDGITIPDTLESGLKGLANGVSAFSSAGGNISLAVSSMDSLVNAVERLASVSFASIVDGLSSISDISGTFSSAISNAVDSINAKKSSFKTAGEQLANAFVNGVESDSSGVSDAMKTALSDAVTAIRNYYTRFSTAGSYVVSGFASGITENTFKAEAAAKAMAQAALDAAKSVLKIKSPSREFYSAGNFAGLGFVNALYDYVSVSHKAGYSMADSAREGLNTAVEKMNAIINSSGDMTPTIRPVLDLSDVKSGADSISNMLNLGSSVGVMTNVGAISSMMNQNGQNGNSEVVSAINKLRKDLNNNTGATQYNINGITYDDGSNVSNAVGELVRAAKIERRA